MQGDWHITSHVIRRDAQINVNGSVWLETGGVLELHNSTLQVLCSFDREFNVTWRGGRLLSRGSTVGGHFAAGLCMHANLFLYDGAWDSTGDEVRCSYGILFSPSTVGWLRATGLHAGVSADSVIMGGRGRVNLTDSSFSLNLGLTVAPGARQVHTADAMHNCNHAPSPPSPSPPRAAPFQEARSPSTCRPTCH